MASWATTLARWPALIPSSSMDSNTMFSWHGAIAVGDAGSIRSDLGGRVILLLAIGVKDTAGASPKSEIAQQLMEIGEGGHRSAWFTQFHA